MTRWLPLAIAAILLALAAAFATRLRIDEDITTILPDNDEMVRQYRYFLKNFQPLDNLYFDVGPTDTQPAAPGNLIAAGDALAATLKQSPLIANVTYRPSPRELVATQERLAAAYRGLLTARDFEELESRMEPGALAGRLAELRKRLLDPSGAFLQQAIRSDPLGIQELLLERLQEAGGLKVRGGTMDGRIWSPDGNHLLVVARPSFPSLDTLKAGDLERLVTAAMRSAEAVPGAMGRVHITAFGSHLIALDNARAMKRDITLAMVTISVFVAVMGLLVFRRRSFPPLVFLPAAFGILVALGVAGFLGRPISGIAIGCGAALVGITVDYGIQALFLLDQPGVDERLHPTRRLRPLILPLCLASGTTIFSFFTLFTSALPGQRQLGLFSAIGVLASAWYAITVLPRHVPTLPRSSRQPLLHVTALASRLIAFRQGAGRGIAVAGLLILAVAAAGVTRLGFDGDFRNLNYMAPPRREAEQRLEKVWGELGGTPVVTPAASEAEALRACERVTEVLEAERRAGRVGSVSSLSSLLPSPEGQRERFAAWKEFWTPERRTLLRERLATAGAPLKFSREAFAPFLDSLDLEPVAMTPESLAGTAVAPLVAMHVSKTGGGAMGQVSFTLSRPETRDTVQDAVRSAVPTAQVVDLGAFVRHTSVLSRGELYSLAIGSAAATALVIALLLPYLDLLVIVFLPTLAGAFVTLGVLGLSGTPINIISSIFVVYVFGTGIDYGIYLTTSALSRHRHDPADQTGSAGAVILCALTTTSGFGAMALGEHPALRSIGITGMLGIATSVIAAFILVPWCTDWVFHRHQRIISDNATPTDRWIRELYRYLGRHVMGYTLWKYRLDPIYRGVGGLVPRRGLILDLGCGQGLMANILHRESPGRSLVGIDHDEGKVAIARSSRWGAGGCDFREGDFRKQPLPPCDAALLVDVLHYWSPEEQRHALARVAQALRPGGTLVLREGMAGAGTGHRLVSLGERFTTRFRLNRGGDSLNFLPRETYVEVLKELGLNLRSEHPDLGRGSNLVLVFQKDGDA